MYSHSELESFSRNSRPRTLVILTSVLLYVTIEQLIRGIRGIRRIGRTIYLESRIQRDLMKLG
jgi:hypothetical protein